MECSYNEFHGEKIPYSAISGIWTLTRHDADYFTRVGKVGFVKAFELPASAIQPIAPSTPKTFDTGMVGSWIWKPNIDGLCWFFEQVYPHLPATLSIQVAGRGADWLRDRYPNVTYWGFVEDARAFLSEARTIAIPSTGAVSSECGHCSQRSMSVEVKQP